MAAPDVEIVFRAMQEAGEKMDDRDVIGRVSVEDGLAADDVLARSAG